VRSGRLLSIVLLLQARGRASARELADHLGVSLRTVYRDVEVLSSIGVPVYAETGRAGGYRLVDGYRTSLTGLTADESLALFLIGLPDPAASLGLGEQARSAEAKLLAALGPGPREQAGRLRDRFLLDLPAWYSEAEQPPALAALAGAVLENRRVRIRYWRWAEPREVRRTLDPHGLVVKNGTWYAVAADRTRRRAGAAMRVYRVSNILEIDESGETFNRVGSFDLTEFWRERLADFDRRRVTGTARLRVAPPLVEQLPDLPDRTLRDAVRRAPVDVDGWRTVDIPLESAANGAAALIRYGGQVQVLSPPELQTELQQLARAVLSAYAG
jgi:predicted DNA-binding transcriptional regulator YafY